MSEDERSPVEREDPDLAGSAPLEQPKKPVSVDRMCYVCGWWISPDHLRCPNCAGRYYGPRKETTMPTHAEIIDAMEAIATEWHAAYSGNPCSTGYQRIMDVASGGGGMINRQRGGGMINRKLFICLNWVRDTYNSGALPVDQRAAAIARGAELAFIFYGQDMMNGHIELGGEMKPDFGETVSLTLGENFAGYVFLDLEFAYLPTVHQCSSSHSIPLPGIIERDHACFVYNRLFETVKKAAPLAKVFHYGHPSSYAWRRDLTPQEISDRAAWMIDNVKCDGWAPSIYQKKIDGLWMPEEVEKTRLYARHALQLAKDSGKETLAFITQRAPVHEEGHELPKQRLSFEQFDRDLLELGIEEDVDGFALWGWGEGLWRPRLPAKLWTTCVEYAGITEAEAMEREALATARLRDHILDYLAALPAPVPTG